MDRIAPITVITLARKHIRFSLFLAFLLILALWWGIISHPPPVPFSCVNFTESYWKEFNFNVDTSEDVVSTVNRLWGFDEDGFGLFEVLTFENRWGTPSEVSWARIALAGPIGVYSGWIQDGTLQKIDVQWIFPLPRPTLSQVIACLGAPEYYIAFYQQSPEAVATSLDLLYPGKGIVVRYESPFTSSSRPEPLDKFHPFMRVAQVVVVAPGTPEQMVPAVYSAGNVGGGYADNACLSKPWPGSTKALEIAPITEFSGCWARGEESE